jgi:hypothetical protein
MIAAYACHATISMCFNAEKIADQALAAIK